MRVFAQGTAAHVTVGSTVTAAVTDFYVPKDSEAVISIGRPASNRVTGITKGSPTTIDFAEGTGCPFEVDDVIVISGCTGVTGFNTTAKVLSINNTAANSYQNPGYFSERITTDHDSRTLNSDNVVVTAAEARRQLAVSAVTDHTTAGQLFAQQVQISGDA